MAAHVQEKPEGRAQQTLERSRPPSAGLPLRRMQEVTRDFWRSLPVIQSPGVRPPPWAGLARGTRNTWADSPRVTLPTARVPQ